MPSRRVKSGSTADTAAGGPLDGVTVTILNPDKRIGTHMFASAERNDGGPALNRGQRAFAHRMLWNGDVRFALVVSTGRHNTSS